VILKNINDAAKRSTNGTAQFAKFYLELIEGSSEGVSRSILQKKTEGNDKDSNFL